MTQTKRSESLTETEIKELKDFTNSCDTTTEAAIRLAISREALVRVLLAGSGKPKTVQQIRVSLKRLLGTEKKRKSEAKVA